MALTKVFNRMINGSSANVLDFGAKGDGVTDDTAAIQAAFNSGAKEVVLPSGTFLIGTTASDYINITSAHNGMTFRGAGGVIKLADNTPVASSKSALQITGVSNFRVTGIRYDGNATNNTDNTLSSTGLVGFSNVLSSDGVIFSENIIENSNNNGVYFTQGTERGLCVNNIFRNCFGTEMRVGVTPAEGIFMGNTAILDTNIHPGVPKQDGMFAIKYSGSALFTGNKLIVDAGVTDLPANLIWITNPDRVNISNNEIINNAGTAYCVQADMDGDADQIIIRGNTFIGGQGILFQDDGTARTIKELVIADNILKAQSQDGIIVRETGAGLFDVSDTVITGNIVEYSSGYGISCAQNGASISNNKVTKLGGSHGLFISGSNLVCSGNVVDVAASTSRGIEIYATDSVFTGNRVYNYTGIPIREQGSANWNLIHGNHTKGGTITTIGANTVLANNI